MRALWITALVIVVDQTTKIIVLNTMMRHQSIPILGDWLKFTFTENPGMAFGLTFGPAAMVTVFSIVATFLIVLYMYKVGRTYTPYRISLAFVLGGAIGNIIDRVFYGVILGYDGLFLGKVVDFIHVNVWRGYIPEVVPFLGGSYLALFPIWNVADMAIVAGVTGILVYQRRFHDFLYAQRMAAEAPASGATEAPDATAPPAEDATPLLDPIPATPPDRQNDAG